MPITFAHPHIRIRDIAESLDFYCGKLGLAEVSRIAQDGFTLIYLSAPADIAGAKAAPPPMLELAHVAFFVDDLDETCTRLAKQDVTISVPPQPQGYAYIVSPDGLTIELLKRPG